MPWMIISIVITMNEILPSKEYWVKLMDDNLVTMTFEIDRDVYDRASEICEQLGTTIEIMTESLLKFCVIPENLPLLKAYLGIENAPAEADANEKVNQMVLEKVYAIAIKQGI